MAVLDDAVSAEVFRHFAKAGFERRFAAGAADAGFGVADDAAASVDDLRVYQGANGKIRGSRITAWIRDEARFSDGFAMELRQAVRRFGQQIGGGVTLLVPAR